MGISKDETLIVHWSNSWAFIETNNIGLTRTYLQTSDGFNLGSNRKQISACDAKEEKAIYNTVHYLESF
jgi:hypothetical protein